MAKLVNFNRFLWLFLLLLVATSLVFSTSKSHAQSNQSITIPSGLSDTAFNRAFDNALRDIDQNQDIEWDTVYDTPTASQLFELFNNYSDFTTSDTSVKSGSTRADTELIERPDVPVSLYVVERYKNGALNDYKKEVTRDTELN